MLAPLVAAPVLVLGALLFGCTTVHEVTVDAIRDSAASDDASYRLAVAHGTARPTPEPMEEVLLSVREALATIGAYEAPAGVAPQQIIHVEAGVGPGHRKIVYEATVEPLYSVSRKDRKQIIAHEKYIRLSAREPVPPGATTQGRELWSVHVSIDDDGRELAPYLPVLSAALRDHIADQSPEEKTILIKESGVRRPLGQKGSASPR
jgi:hypothetical protein